MQVALPQQPLLLLLRHGALLLQLLQATPHQSFCLCIIQWSTLLGLLLHLLPFLLLLLQLLCLLVLLRLQL